MAGSSKALAFLLAKPKIAASIAVAATAVAGTGVATYNAGPGDTLWGLEKSIFSSHAQEVAVNDVADNLKSAQALLAKNPLGADDLGQARNYLNQAKLLLDDTTNIPDANQRAGLQQLYLQLTQNLTDSVPPPADLPPAPDADLASDAQGSTSNQAAVQLPTWGYSTPVTNASPAAAITTVSAPPAPATVAGADISNAPTDPDPDWTDPTPAAATLNQQDLGYYDPSWDSVYNYNRGDWHRWGLDGYNPYGYDYTGYDRWGYDRHGYDRWGYDHGGRDRYGYNYAGWRYDNGSRQSWHRNGYNEWGQRRGHSEDRQDSGWRDKWYNRYQGYYENRWYHNDPVYQRRQWDRDEWRRHNPGRNDNDAAFGIYVDNNRLKVFTPVANLSVSLGQFVDIQVPRQTRDLVRNGTLAALRADDIVSRTSREAAPFVQARRQQDQFLQRQAADASAKVAVSVPYGGSLNAELNTQATADPGRPNGPRPTQQRGQTDGQIGMSGSVEAAAQVTTPSIGASIQQLQQEQQQQQEKLQKRIPQSAKVQIQAQITQEQKARPTTPPKQSAPTRQQQTAPSQQQQTAPSQQQQTAPSQQQQTAPSQQERPGRPSGQERPSQPSQQTAPSQQERPSQPSQQERPSQPSQQTAPSQRERPSQPSQQERPSQPSQQERPSQPSQQAPAQPAPAQPAPTQQKPASQERTQQAPTQERPASQERTQQRERPQPQEPRQERPQQQAPAPTQQQAPQAPANPAPAAPQPGNGGGNGGNGGHGH